jgi:hypothetical protein
LNNVREDLQPEPAWVCVRDGVPRGIDEHDCATCAFWEFDDGQSAVPTVAIAAPDTAPQVAPLRFVEQAVTLLTWSCVLLAALILGAVGLTILTSPYAVPITVSLWLTAAGLIGFAATGHLDVHR